MIRKKMRFLESLDRESGNPLMVWNQNFAELSSREMLGGIRRTIWGFDLIKSIENRGKTIDKFLVFFISVFLQI